MANTVESADHGKGEKEENGIGLETISYVLLPSKVLFLVRGGGGSWPYVPHKKKILRK